MADNSWVDQDQEDQTRSLTSALTRHIAALVEAAGGFLSFDAYMAAALYTPGLGYYANGLRKFGLLPGDGSDFATAPQISPYFGRALARQVAQALQCTGCDEVWEFGAGSGALAATLLDALPDVRRYRIVELSGDLRERQRVTLEAHAARVSWEDRLPARMAGVVIGNEVLDAMPVQLLARGNGRWRERGVAWHDGALTWAERDTALKPPLEVPGGHDYVTEIAPQVQAFVRTVMEALERGAAFLIDYGFPEAEYYHPQRDQGTLMCHRGHLSDTDPLHSPGLKDITAHVDFSAVALAAQDAGAQVLGYTSQARFLLNCGLLESLAHATLPERAMAQKLIQEHEMGELFKVIGLAARGWDDSPWQALGFDVGDRTHTL